MMIPPIVGSIGQNGNVLFEADGIFLEEYSRFLPSISGKTTLGRSFRKYLILEVFGPFLSVLRRNILSTYKRPGGDGVNTLWRSTYRRARVRGDAKFMNWGLFESFCELLESLPIKAIVRAADAERRMVEDDLRYKRTELDENVTSVLGFCNFLTLAVHGNHPSATGFPYEHRVFYASVVRRLVDAGELSPEFKEQFEETPSINSKQQSSN